MEELEEGPVLEPTPSSARELFRPSRTSMVAPQKKELLHPRGRILPPLEPAAPISYRFVRGLTRLVQGLYFHEVTRIAPAMAFHFFLSLLPLLAFIGYVIGVLSQRKGVSTVIALALENLPDATESVLEREIQHLAGADRLGPLAAIGFLWIASGGIQGLMEAVETVVGAPRRAWWKQRLLALGWVVMVLAAFGLASAWIIEWDNVVATVEASERPPAAEVAPAEVRPERPRRPRLHVGAFLRGSGPRKAAIAISFVAAGFGLAAFYRFSVTHSPKIRRRVVPGAALAVTLCMIVSWAFGLYLRTLASYTVYYGSLAAVAVLLIWLWLMSLAILVGAELNSQLEGLRD